MTDMDALEGKIMKALATAAAAQGVGVRACSARGAARARRACGAQRAATVRLCAWPHSLPHLRAPSVRVDRRRAPRAGRSRECVSRRRSSRALSSHSPAPPSSPRPLHRAQNDDESSDGLGDLLDDDDLNLDGPDGDDDDDDLNLGGSDDDDLDDLDDLGILGDDGPATDDELDDLIDSDGETGAAAPAVEEPSESLDLDDLDLDDSDDEVEANAPAAAPKVAKSKPKAPIAKSSSVKTTPRASRSRSRSAKATPRSTARASGRRARGTRAEHALVVSGQRRKNVWSGAGSVNSRHELKYGEERRLTADVQHQKLSAAERAEALDRLAGQTAKERAARKAATRADALESASAKMHNVGLYLTKYKGPQSSTPNGMASGPVADRLYQSALQKRKKLEEARKNYEEEIDRRHKLVMKESSARSAKILRRAEKTRPGLADRQAAYRRNTGGASQNEGNEQLSQATFTKMLKRLKYEMKECTFKPKTTWKEYRRTREAEEAKLDRAAGAGGAAAAKASARRRAAGAEMNHLDHLKVEDRLLEKGQLAMRQLIADRAKAATDKMRECQNKGGGLFEPEIIPMNPAVRKAVRSHFKSKHKVKKIRKRSKTAAGRKKVFNRLYKDSAKKQRNIQKLRRKQLEEEFRQNTFHPTVAPLAATSGKFEEERGGGGNAIYERLNRESVSRKERVEAAARAAALARAEEEMEECTFHPTFKGSAMKVRARVVVVVLRVVVPSGPPVPSAFSV